MFSQEGDQLCEGVTVFKDTQHVVIASKQLASRPQHTKTVAYIMFDPHHQSCKCTVCREPTCDLALCAKELF